MSKSSKKIDDRQLSLLDYLQQINKPSEETEGQFKIIDRLRASLRSAIKGCHLNRYRIAGEMSHHLGESITKEMIDSWTRSSDEINGRAGRHIPAEYLPALCHVTGNSEPLKIMGRLVGLFVLPGPDALRAEIEKDAEAIRAAQARNRKRKLFIKEMEQKI